MNRVDRAETVQLPAKQSVDQHPEQSEAEQLRAETLKLSRRYASFAHPQHRPVNDSLRPACGGWSLPYASSVFTEDELETAVGCSLDFWLMLGAEGQAFEQELAAFLGVR